MTRKLFGTDGIRGTANIYPMTPELAINLGRAVTYYFQKKSRYKGTHPLIVVGKDTRLSCYMLELAFSSGVCSQGGKVILTGPLPTPAVSFATSNMRASAGVMISASHNSYTDNGIKLFDQEGKKLPDHIEAEIEMMALNPDLIETVAPDKLGKAERLDEVFGRYIVHVKTALSKDVNLEGTRVVLDCAHGASYKVAPMIMKELGAEVFPIGVNPNGQNINLGVGSLYPQVAADDVAKYKADVGVCLDGDADRLIMVDDKANILDGDQLIGILAKYALDRGEIQKGDEVVGTLMSNLGLEKYVESLGLKFFRAKVGDRYILERMRESGGILGGEPSGHLIWRKLSETGDGTAAALRIMEACQYYGKKLSQLTGEFKLYPQANKSIKVSKKPALDSIPEIKKAIENAEEKLLKKGRILVRYSGTEPKARIMVEGENESLVHEVAAELTQVLSEHLK